MTGVKGRSGPRKKRETQYDDWIRANPGKIVSLLEVLCDKGLDGDREAAIYVIDRVLGRPRQEIDQRVKVLQLSVSGDDLARLQLKYEEAERLLLDNAT